MKTILLTWLFVCWVSLTLAQHKPTHASFGDYPLVENFDSLATSVGGLRNNPQGYLRGLITLEKNRIDYPGLFGQDLNTIKLVANQLHDPLAVATYHYLQSVHLRETNLGEAARHGLEAIRYFESTKDTSGMLACYSSMVLISMNTGEYPIKNVQKQAYYYDEIMKIGAPSTNAYYKITQLKTVLSLEKFVKGKMPFETGIKTVDEVINLLKNNPKNKPIYATVYSSIARFYSTHSQHKSALYYSIRSYEYYKSKSSKICATASYNLGYTYFSEKLYSEAEKYYREAIQCLEQLQPDKFSLLISSYIALADIQFINKEYATAWSTKEKIYSLYNKRHQKMKSSLFEELETQRDTDQKNIENKLLVEKNKLAELRNKQLEQEARIKLLLAKNQLTQSQNLNYRKELENISLVHRNHLIESRSRQYQSWLTVSGLVSLVVGLLLYLLYKSTVRQRELTRFREKLYTIIAHDLREPINSLMSVGTLLRHLVKQNRADDVERVTQKIDLMGQQVSLLLNTLLEWGKSTYMDTHTPPQKFDATPLLNELTQLYGTLAETKGITLSVQIPASYPIIAHPKDVSLIVRNLLDNALKHTLEGGSILLSVDPHQSVIRVADTGIGMAPDQLVYIRQIFAGKVTPQVGAHGVGLGLILISDFARKNGATLRLNSQEGIGSAVDLILV